MRTQNGWTRVFTGGLLGLALVAAPMAVRADESDPIDDALKAKVAEAQAARERAVRPPDGVVVGLRLGEARFARELARVDVTLEATNSNAGEIEWERTFPMDPKAEVIRCSLQRGNGVELVARTLTFEDGRRLYGEASGRPAPVPARGRDPLRVERQRPEELRVTVFPMAPSETVRVRLAFVTPLEGTGRNRVYSDPVWLENGPAERVQSRRRDTTPPNASEFTRTPSWVTLTTLLVEPGGLAYDRALPGMLAAPSAGTRLAFRPEHVAYAGSRARVAFRAPEGALPALAVRGGGLGTRVAVWRFDPVDFLATRGLTATPEAQLKVVGLGGFTQRVVPGFLETGAPAQTMAARVLSGAEAVTYTVEVETTEGVRRIECTEPIARADVTEDLLDAVTAWHRARLARHVISWAGADPLKVAKAVAYAVDLGVLLPGTAALAIPEDEMRRLSRESRRTYRRDGALLGSPNGESDMIPPPEGSIR